MSTSKVKSKTKQPPGVRLYLRLTEVNGSTIEGTAINDLIGLYRMIDDGFIDILCKDGLQRFAVGMLKTIKVIGVK